MLCCAERTQLLTKPHWERHLRGVSPLACRSDHGLGRVGCVPHRTGSSRGAQQDGSLLMEPLLTVLLMTFLRVRAATREALSDGSGTLFGPCSALTRVSKFARNIASGPLVEDFSEPWENPLQKALLSIFGHVPGVQYHHGGRRRPALTTRRGEDGLSMRRKSRGPANMMFGSTERSRIAQRLFAFLPLEGRICEILSRRHRSHCAWVVLDTRRRRPPTTG